MTECHEYVGQGTYDALTGPEQRVKTNAGELPGVLHGMIPQNRQSRRKVLDDGPNGGRLWLNPYALL